MKADFRTLIGGRQFLVNIELGRNGSYIKSVAHIDGGANIFGAIRTSVAYQLRKLFGISFLTLPKPIVPTGYNGEEGTAITHAVLLTLTIDKRRINFPFLVTELGSTEVLIGRKFLEHYDLKQDYSKGKNQLLWPTDMPEKLYFEKRLQLQLARFEPSTYTSYQEDAERRDKLLAQDEYRRTQARIAGCDANSGSPKKLTTVNLATKPATTSRPSPFVRELKKGLLKIEELVSRHQNTLPSTREPGPRVKEAPATPELKDESYKMDIHSISAAAMYQIHLRPRKKKKSGVETFVASLDDLNTEMRRREERGENSEVELSTVDDATPEEAREAKYQSNEDLIRRKLPPQYKGFEILFSSRASDNLSESRLTVDHKIELTTENNLSFEPLRRMSDEQLSETKRYILENLHKGFISPSNVPFAAPILFAKKADGSLRFCVDYRKLNELTKKDPYPIPLIDEMMARISKARIFTKIDIQQAFHKIRMDTDSEDYTTFRTRYGSYKYKVLPFGLTNGPATFQRFINDILMEHLDDFCSAYLDDILIYSESPEEHEVHVKKVMQILLDHCLQADIKKCEFGVKKTKFLGFIIGVDGIEVDPEKIAVINNWEYATNVRGVQSYLGFCNFYRRFIQDYSRVCRPLTLLTGKDVPFEFNDNCKAAWEALRSALKSAPILCHYDAYRQTRLETDSSDGVVAGILSQLQDDGHFHPVGFFSKTMGDAELNYPIHDKELLAIFRAFKQYKPELLGAQKTVHVYTDHRALEYFMSTKDLTARQARWAEFFADFHFMIMYRTGVTNTLADTLSRRDQDLSPLEAKKRALRSQQMIPDDKVDPRILEERENQADKLTTVNLAVELSPVDDEPLEPEPEFLVGEAPDPASAVAYDIEGYDIIDQVISANKTSPDLESLRKKASEYSLDYELR